MQVEVEDHGVVIVNFVPTILYLAILESASLAIDGTKIKNSTTSSFLSVEDEDDKNYAGEWKLNHSRFVGLLDPMCHFVCSLFHWNMRYSFALSLLKADKSLC